MQGLLILGELLGLRRRSQELKHSQSLEPNTADCLCGVSPCSSIEGNLRPLVQTYLQKRTALEIKVKVKPARYVFP